MMILGLTPPRDVFYTRNEGASPLESKVESVFFGVQENLIQIFELVFSSEKALDLVSKVNLLASKSLRTVQARNYLEIARACVFARALFKTIIAPAKRIPLGWVHVLKEDPLWKERHLFCPFSGALIRNPVFVQDGSFGEITIANQFCEKESLERFARESILTKRVQFEVDTFVEGEIEDSLKRLQMQHIETIQDAEFFEEGLLSILLEESLSSRKSLVTSGARVASMALHYFQFMSECAGPLDNLKRSIRGKAYIKEAIEFDQRYITSLEKSGVVKTATKEALGMLTPI